MLCRCGRSDAGGGSDPPASEPCTRLSIRALSSPSGSRRPSLASGVRPSEHIRRPMLSDACPSDPADPGEVRAGPSRVQPPACGSAKKKSEGLASEIIFCYSSCGSSCDGSLALSYSVIFPVGVVCSVYHLSFLYLLVYIYYTIG